MTHYSVREWHDPQVTTIQADAADEAAISGVCKQALQEEGRLDVFFANVRSNPMPVNAANKYLL